MARHVKKGDTVVVVAGADKGKVGQVLRVEPRRGKVLVQGVNRVYRHLRPSRGHPQGGRIQKDMPIGISNVLPVDPKTNQPSRVGFTLKSDGTKERVALKSRTSLGVVKKAR
ncbi:MAG TPA: 50S ribosomal protein L24 [Phycisphaerae bacterium]|nr:50S ribosomal protein L24 [Phycisphaerae bacterium]